MTNKLIICKLLFLKIKLYLSSIGVPIRELNLTCETIDITDKLKWYEWCTTIYNISIRLCEFFVRLCKYLLQLSNQIILYMKTLKKSKELNQEHLQNI